MAACPVERMSRSGLIGSPLMCNRSFKPAWHALQAACLAFKPCCSFTGCCWSMLLAHNFLGGHQGMALYSSRDACAPSWHNLSSGSHVASQQALTMNLAGAGAKTSQLFNSGGCISIFSQDLQVLLADKRLPIVPRTALGSPFSAQSFSWPSLAVGPHQQLYGPKCW